MPSEPPHEVEKSAEMPQAGKFCYKRLMNATLPPPAETPSTRLAQRRTQAVRAAFVALIEALGVADAADSGTVARATALWLDHLLAGQGRTAAAALGRGTPHHSQTPILLEQLGFHMVCPHHLTVSWGSAAVAYVPGGRVVGFGRLADLVHVCTARLVLQEDATNNIAQTLMRQLAAQAVAVRLQASHPCHTVLHPRSHGAQATTWGLEGDLQRAATLQNLLCHVPNAKLPQ